MFYPMTDIRVSRIPSTRNSNSCDPCPLAAAAAAASAASAAESPPPWVKLSPRNSVAYTAPPSPGKEVGAATVVEDTSAMMTDWSVD